jgi:hypothetical protein
MIYAPFNREFNLCFCFYVKRLTRSGGDEFRNSTMRAYIGNDLLGCAFPGEYQVFSVNA